MYVIAVLREWSPMLLIGPYPTEAFALAAVEAEGEGAPYDWTTDCLEAYVLPVASPVPGADLGNAGGDWERHVLCTDASREPSFRQALHDPDRMFEDGDLYLCTEQRCFNQGRPGPHFEWRAAEPESSFGPDGRFTECNGCGEPVTDPESHW